MTHWPADQVQRRSVSALGSLAFKYRLMDDGKEARRTSGFDLRRRRAVKCVEGISPKA